MTSWAWLYVSIALITGVATASFFFRLKDVIRRKPTPNQPALDRYMAATMAHLSRMFLYACVCWVFFYVALFLGELYHGKVFEFATNACTNLTSYFLLSFYVELSASGHRERRGHHGIRSTRPEWLFLFVSLMTYEALTKFSGSHPEGPPALARFPFTFVYGLGQAIALYLVIGRLDVISISEHMAAARNHTSKFLSRFHWWSIFAGYLYASIQPLYPLFENEKWTIPYLVVGALVLKLWMIGWIYMLLRHRGQPDAPTALEFHAYEMQRFVAEDISEFERKFLRLHFTPLYVRRYKERKIGYLGIDYTYLNDFKLERLGLWSKAAGILVKDVYLGSDAAAKGICKWDVVIAVNGTPVGLKNRLSEVLVGNAPGDVVEVELLRKRKVGERAENADHYDLCRLNVTLGEYDKTVKLERSRPSDLNCEILYNSRWGGVVCRWEDHDSPSTITGIRSEKSGRHFEIPDTKMLRIVMEQLDPGDAIEVHGSNLPKQSGDDPVSRTLLGTTMP